MRRFGAVLHRTARQHPFPRSRVPAAAASSSVVSHLQEQCHHTSRFLTTQSTYLPSEDLPPHSQPSDQVSSSISAVVRKRARPSRLTDLYNALIYEDGASTNPDESRKVMALESSGLPVSATDSDVLKARLEECRQFAHAEFAINVLEDVERNGRIPTARAIIMAIEACLPAEEYAHAETALARLDALPVGHESRSAKLVTSARCLIAVSYTRTNRYEDALRVMNLSDYQSIEWQRKEQVLERLNKLRIGRDTVAWGVLVKALTKLDRADAAVAVVDVALGQGIGMTDSLLHLTLDALRVLGRPRQAEWLFDEAIRKGVKPRELTVASLLLTLTAKLAKRAVNVAKIEELVDMVPEPTPRFRSTALLVLSAVGSLQRSEKLFESMAKEGTPSEHAFTAVMAAYGRYFDAGWETGGAEEDTPAARAGVAKRAEKHWMAYLASYGSSKPNNAQLRRLRVVLLHRYLLVKTRCCRLGEAVNLLDEVASGDIIGMGLTSGHVSGVLGAAELACDVTEMRRVIGVMEKSGLRHDVRSLTYCIGTYLGDGNLGEALKLVRTEAPRLLADGYNADGLKEYHWTLLGRRLEMLASAMKEAGGGRVRDLDVFIDIVKMKPSL